jgi:hypothetical protein
MATDCGTANASMHCDGTLHRFHGVHGTMCRADSPCRGTCEHAMGPTSAQPVTGRGLGAAPVDGSPWLDSVDFNHPGRLASGRTTGQHTERTAPPPVSEPAP